MPEHHPELDAVGAPGQARGRVAPDRVLLAELIEQREREPVAIELVDGEIDVENGRQSGHRPRALHVSANS